MRLGIALAGMCLLTFTPPLQGDPPMVEHIPAEALFYAGWAGRSLPFDGSVMGELLLTERGVSEILSGLKSFADSNLKGKDAELFSHAWAMGATAWAHPIAIAVTGIEAEQGNFTLSALGLIDLAGDREVFEGHLNSALGCLGSDRVSVSEATIGTVTYKVIEGLPEELGKVSLGFKGNIFFIAIGDGTCEQFIQLTPEGALSGDAKFAEHHQAVGGQNEQISFYLDVSRTLKQIEQIFREDQGKPASEEPSVSQLTKITTALGLDRVTAVVGSVRIVDRGALSRTRIFTPAPHRGLLMPLTGSPLTETDLAIVPADADFLRAIRLSPEALWAEIRQIVRQIDPDSEAKLLRGTEGIEGDLGVSINDDILANLGDTVLVYSAPSQGGFLTGTVLSVSAKDTEKLSAAITRIEESLSKKLAGETYYTCPNHPDIRRDEEGICPKCEAELVLHKTPASKASIETARFGRTEVRYIRGLGGDIPSPVTPGWAIHKDRLYIAGWAQVIGSVLQSNGTSNPVTSQETYRKARSMVSEKASVLSYTNTPQIMRQIYNYLLIGWTLGANILSENTPINARPDWLPPLPTLEKYLWENITAVSSDEKGITFESYGSLPISGGWLTPLNLPTTAGILLPSLNRARAQAKHAVSASNLNHIGMMVALYQGEHDDQFPPDLAALVKEGMPPHVLVSPLSGREPPKMVDGRLVGEVDYVYIKHDSRSPGNMIVAYERPDVQRRGNVNVLFVDSQVSRMRRGEFRQALQRTKEYLKDLERSESDF